MSPRDGALLAILTVIWGLNWPIMKMALLDFAPLTFRAISLVGGVAVMALIVRLQGHSLAIARRCWAEVAVLGLFNLVLWFVLSILGIAMLTSGRAAILGYTLPVWVAVIGTLFYGERHGPRLLFALLFAAVGIGLLLAEEFSRLAGRPAGLAMMLLAALTWAIGVHRLRRRRVPAPIVVLTFWMMLQSFLACGVLAILFEQDRWTGRIGFESAFSLVYNIVLAYGVAQVLWFRLASLLPPVMSTLSVMLIPVVGVFSGAWLLDERPVLADYLALGAMVAAIALALLPPRRAAGAIIGGQDARDERADRGAKSPSRKEITE